MILKKQEVKNTAIEIQNSDEQRQSWKLNERSSTQTWKCTESVIRSPTDRQCGRQAMGKADGIRQREIIWSELKGENGRNEGEEIPTWLGNLQNYEKEPSDLRSTITKEKPTSRYIAMKCNIRQREKTLKTAQRKGVQSTRLTATFSKFQSKPKALRWSFQRAERKWL